MAKVRSSIVLQSFSVQERLATGTIALLLGTFLLMGVGFVGSSIMHNAAHDTRHALTFPCH